MYIKFSVILVWKKITIPSGVYMDDKIFLS